MGRTKLKILISGVIGAVIVISLLYNFAYKFISFDINKLGCGIQSLIYVFKNFGIEITKQDLKKFIAYSNKGENNLYQLYREATRKKLNAVGVKMSLEDIKKLKVVAICHLWDNHFVVLEPLPKEGKVRMYDPLTKKQKRLKLRNLKNIIQVLHY